MSEVHEGSLKCERDDCPTLTFRGPVGSSVGCPAQGCGKSIGAATTTGNGCVAEDDTR